jgi:hypothetical protein
VDSLSVAAALLGSLSKVWAQKSDVAAAEKRTYRDKLEGAQGDDIFKYLLLINTASLEEYVAQTRLQAEQSFRLSRIVALLGFVLLVVGIAFGFYTSLQRDHSLSAAYLASVAGLLVEFISGVFFYMFNKTLQQINLFHDKMVSAQHVAVSFLANGLVADSTQRDQLKGDLAKGLISAVSGEPRTGT